ncbi:hypothetical protein F8568_016375 [Actinomadura sp. LD22]|uniref:Uncharacterized protein n=1 Tax=Actinomadura physcomitrii TaxID=2650748 RepID=A0A6I4MH25_9ACTN|nr:hypothetical protein [Actinomadura physcomitrii]MWA01919.1 hypothetical protein [Actinomadura physcomitrii]
MKEQVINRIRALDTRVRIRTTDYFNNTFVPDIVLSWPGEERSRELFIRADTNPEHLAEDIGLVPDRKPIFYGLGSVSSSAEHNSLVSSEAQDHGVLITDAAGADEFVARRRRTDLLGLASAAVLQGGRGVVDREEAADTATLFEDGFESARRGDSLRTASAAGRIASVLDSDRTDRLLQVLQALWVGSGQPASLFPAAVKQDHLDDSALLFLLEQDWIKDTLFWRNLGHSLKFDQLVSLDLSEPTENLQELIWANSDRLKARASAAVASEVNELPGKRFAYFTIEDGGLAFRMRHSLLRLYGSADQLPETVKSTGVPLGDVLQRLRLLMRDRTPVRTIEFVDEGRKWTCESEGDTGVFDDADFMRVISTAGPNAQVRRVAVRSAEGNLLKLNFTNDSVTGYGSSRFEISQLVTLALLAFPRFDPEEGRVAGEAFAMMRAHVDRLSGARHMVTPEESPREIDDW